MSKIVKVIDSMMGTGKTSYAIQMMKEAEINEKFIFVTPFLDEVQRIKKEVHNRDFKEPDAKHGSGTKLESLKRLISKGEDIVTTHALFAMADDELIELLSWSNYTLIMDEVMSVICQIPVRKGDIQMMLNGGAIEVDESGRVTWKEHPKFDTTFSIVRDYAIAGNLYLVNNIAFVWNFPAKIFNLFDRVYIMTYMFDGQLQKYYYDLHNVQYDYYLVVKEKNRYELGPSSDVPEDRSYLKNLIHIYEGNLNEIGHIDNTLSKSWFINNHNKVNVKCLKNNLYNFLRNIHKAPADKILWTTFKDYKRKIEGNGFRKEEPENTSKVDVGQACFIPFNLRATNKYRHKDVLAFCLNRFIHPIEEHFFEQHNVKVDEDLLALSDLLQWIFRSAVREGKPVHIYIPSRRMRELLKKWLNNEI
ncbi:DEAD/DEAH box helicase family protein [Bacillus sp. ISL-7]|uniref:DEAD/DEAH box helicase family protein n=1 Tax=Bacillus sp. ISL-7 TaxID=2819136 RepID=UPI001BED33A9|nr:DEAD/DEAH box helicase family protein [Bacillus sp. ISL-7]MBT2736595.1 DEAD/DEAH box helicase family protein [Bacillus sp. ISL-7]